MCVTGRRQVYIEINVLKSKFCGTPCGQLQSRSWVSRSVIKIFGCQSATAGRGQPVTVSGDQPGLPKRPQNSIALIEQISKIKMFLKPFVNSHALFRIWSRKSSRFGQPCQSGLDRKPNSIEEKFSRKCFQFRKINNCSPKFGKV